MSALGDAAEPSSSLERLSSSVIRCRLCPRLVAWREEVAANPRASFRGETYWGRPLPGFGDPDPWLLVVGLAPAAHGANRTGRMFTGDRSGDWLYRALHKAGLASQPTSASREDGLRLVGTYVTAAVRCAPPGNRPTVAERDSCRPFLEAEMRICSRVSVIVALGGFAYAQILRILAERGLPVPKPRPRFTHGVEAEVGSMTVLASYHPSQQNTFTRKLTEPMFDGIWRRALELRDGTAPGAP